MIEIRNLDEQFARASARVATSNLSVEPSTLLRQYRVTNNAKGVTYRVDFFKTRDGRKFVTCECQGGQNGYVCKHTAAALPIHLQTMREHHAAAREAADKAFGDFAEAPAPVPTRAELLGDFSGLDDEDDARYSYRAA